MVSLNSRGETPLSEKDVSADFANKSQLIKKDLSDETLDSESDDDADKVYEELVNLSKEVHTKKLMYETIARIKNIISSLYKSAVHR